MLERGKGFSRFIRDLERSPHTEERSEYDYTGDWIEKDSIEKFLPDPDSNRGLVNSLIWDETPQGHSHWRLIQLGVSEVTASDLDYLRWLLEECEEGHYDL